MHIRSSIAAIATVSIGTLTEVFIDYLKLDPDAPRYARELMEQNS